MRLTKIDEVTLGEHFYLSTGDKCYFLREYTAGGGYAKSETNNIILNLKKTPDRRGKTEWRWKQWAIMKVATELREALRLDWLKAATLVPMPPSKARHDPLYDDRMVAVLRAVAAGDTLDIRDMLVQVSSTDPAHTSGSRPTVQAIRNSYSLDGLLTTPAPSIIGIFDDVLTTGAHFIAARSLLRERFPGVEILGVFYARRALPTEAVDEKSE